MTLVEGLISLSSYPSQRNRFFSVMVSVMGIVMARVMVSVIVLVMASVLKYSVHLFRFCSVMVLVMGIVMARVMVSVIVLVMASVLGIVKARVMAWCREGYIRSQYFSWRRESLFLSLLKLIRYERD